MALTLVQLRADIYNILGKSDTTYGLLTPAKVNTAINDSLNHIMVQMLGMNAQWDTKQAYLNTVGGSPYVAFPSDCAVINFLKYKVPTGTAFMPMTYNENWDGATTTTSGSTAAYQPIYHFVNNQIFLEPTPDASATGVILIEYIAAPTVLVADADVVNGDFGLATYTNYAKWRAAGILRSITQSDASQVPWAKYEQEAYQDVFTLISRRKRVASVIRGVPY